MGGKGKGTEVDREVGGRQDGENRDTKEKNTNKGRPGE